MDRKEPNGLFQLILVLVAFVGGIVVAAHWFSRDEKPADLEPVEEEVSQTTTTPQVTETPQSTGTKLETVTDIEQILRVAFAEKYEKSPEDVSITINNFVSEYAQGLVGFEGEIGGGWFLAAKKDGAWIIVADGNGTVMCADVEPYAFPLDMVSECWDETTQALIAL